MADITLSTARPYYFPYPDFFLKAYLSDIFVILDSTQFPRRTTWITRNRFKNEQGVLWMTVPVWKKGLGLQKINRVRIYHERGWARKHIESLKNAYGKAPYLTDHLNFMEEIYGSPIERLIDLNLKIIRYLMKQLRVHTKVILLSDEAIEETGDRLLIRICKTQGATRYLTQRSAIKYLNEAAFNAAGIRLVSFTPRSPTYPQLWGDFIANLSALDLILNCGPKAHDIMLGIDRSPQGHIPHIRP